MPNELNLEKSYEAILKAAKAQQFLSYSDIASASAVEWQAARRQISSHLKELLAVGFENDWPMITSIVVNKNNLDNGELDEDAKEGLLSAAEEIGYFIDNRETFLHEQQQAVFEWSQGIDGPLNIVKTNSVDSDSRYAEYMGPVLDALRAEGGLSKPQKIREWLKRNFPKAVSDEANVYSNGKNAFLGYTNKAGTYLRRLKLMESINGNWKLTDKGISVHLSEEDSKKLSRDWQAERRKRNKEREMLAVETEIIADTQKQVEEPPKNLILFGPPGTGKTYQAVNKAVQALDIEFYKRNEKSRDLIIDRFNELKSENRIGLVTFHQSFSYEEFVEGLKASTDENGIIRYQIEDGIFKSLCDGAASQVTKSSKVNIDISGKKIWKMSLGDTLESEDYNIYEECIANNYILLGYGQGIDYTNSRKRDEISKLQSVDDHSANLESYQVRSVYTFINSMQVGDIVIISDGNRKFRAIGEIKGEYKHLKRAEGIDYVQSREVEWLRVYTPSRPREDMLEKNFSQMTLYELKSSTLPPSRLSAILAEDKNYASSFKIGENIGGYRIEKITNEVVSLIKPNGSHIYFAMDMINQLITLIQKGSLTLKDIKDGVVFEKLENSDLEKYIVNGYRNILSPLIERLIDTYADNNNDISRKSSRVIIIDEINRGNIAKIFGELITLIEPNKRAGESEALSVTLPYSKLEFSIPNNLYIIGTMNTADRSLTSIDTALRRRFVFEEIAPQSSLFDDVTVDGNVNIKRIMEAINDRIELLLGAEYQLGHSYFLPIKENPTFLKMAHIFEKQIIPLLQEYFFDDWEKIHRVLGDHQKPKHAQFVYQYFNENEVINLLGNDWQGMKGSCWRINSNSFLNIDSYRGIYELLNEQ